MSEELSKPGRGRPRTADPRALQLVAMRLIDEQGYAATTLADVARQAGVSIRTVHRYFGTKRDMVWREVDADFESVGEALMQADQSLPVMEVVAQALVALLTDAMQDDVTQLRLRLLATEPELRGEYSETFARWSREFARYVADRTGLANGHLIPILVGESARIAIYTAMLRLVDDPTTNVPRTAEAAIGTLSRGIQAAIDEAVAR